MAKTTEPARDEPPPSSGSAGDRTTRPLGEALAPSPLSTMEAAKTVHVGPDRAESAPSAPSEPATQRLVDLQKRWQQRGIDLDTVQVDRGGTVIPDAATLRRTYASTPGPQDVKALPPLRVGEKGTTNAEFEVGAVLGMGGMGVVKTATQTTLERQVAIKELRPEVKDPTASPQLLLEARVTGTLEHPNIVPIHAIGRDARGHPLIVMKRIEGRSWDELIGEIGSEDDDPGDQVLQRHLNILLQVAQATHFAHSRGILHRDLKPANVMIGNFGEVYVVDWGIAVALNDRAPAGLPRARDVSSLSGTPAYMAPEMAAGDGASLSERTDVYLLGAMLHELITGRAPHESPTMLETVRRAFASEPHDYGPDVPQGLVDICHRSMYWNPAERYADAGEFAAAIEAFLHHRSSTVLSDEAAQRLVGLRDELADVDVDDRDQVRSSRALFSEVRFAFAHARKTWPDNQRATEGLQESLELMIDFELKAGAAGAAAALVAELPQPRPELSARVDRALEEQRAARARLEKLEHDADLSIGDRARKLIALLGSVGWCACCVTTGVLRRHELYPVSQLEFGLVCAAFGGLLGLVAYLGRRTLYANVATRRITHATLLVFGAYTVLWPMAHLLGVEPASTTAFSLLAGGMLWLALGLHVQRTWAGMAAGMGLALVATLLWPTYNFEWMGIGSLVGGIIIAWLRHRARRERSESSPEAA